MAKGMHRNKPTRWCSKCQRNFPYNDPMERKFKTAFGGGIL